MSGGAPARTPLDRDRIVAGVFAVGVADFSMHSLARHLGVTATALYRYFESREELLAAAMDALCERIELPDPATPWPDYLRELTRSLHRTLRANPGASAYGMAIGPATPAAFAIVETALQVLRAAGFSAMGAWRAYSLVANHAFNSVQGEERFRALVERNGPGGFRVYQLDASERERFPVLAEMAASHRFDLDETFETGLACVVAGIEAERARGAL